MDNYYGFYKDGKLEAVQSIPDICPLSWCGVRGYTMELISTDVYNNFMEENGPNKENREKNILSE